MARKAIADTVIHAPFAGYQRAIALGQYVSVTSKIATLLRITPIRLELQVPEVNAANEIECGSGSHGPRPGPRFSSA
jgi:multidrug efflux pump subunit AcrA (membrane-fusion protein)